MGVSYGSVPFKEQIDFFRKKVSVPTHAWTDIYADEHNYSFMVAGAARRDLLTDMRGIIDGAIANGTTLAEFRKQFDEVVAKHGWAYNGGRNWRTSVIYDTNLRQSYNAGREAQMADPQLRKARPYGLHRHADGEAHPRPMHLSWDGTVLPLDDSWWDTHTPQNGWHCHCQKFMVSEADVARMGLSVATEAPAVEWEEKTVGTKGPSPRTVRVPKGIDPGFEYRPGPVARARSVTPPPITGKNLLHAIGTASASQKPLPQLAPKKALPSRLLPQDLSDDEYINKFLAEFVPQDKDYVYYPDVTGTRLVINKELLTARGGYFKGNKRDRGRYLLLMADTIKHPQEIWESWESINGQQVLRRRYVAAWQIEGQDIPGLAVFALDKEGWLGVTAFSPDKIEYVNRRARQGTLVWSQNEKGPATDR